MVARFHSVRLTGGKSSRGLEQSKTLRAGRKFSDCAERLGVRWPSTAFFRSHCLPNLVWSFIFRQRLTRVLAFLRFLRLLLLVFFGYGPTRARKNCCGAFVTELAVKLNAPFVLVRFVSVLQSIRFVETSIV